MLSASGGLVSTTVELNKTFIPNIINDVYRDIRTFFLSSDSILDSFVTQIFSRKGKGIRPVFMALVGQLVGGSWESLRRCAALIEAIHIASLLHDDVVDSAELRRGAQTLNIQHSDKISVLFGDHIFISALAIAHDVNNHEVFSIVLEAVNRMIKGEIHDSLTSGTIDEDTYLRIIGDKTASLFAASGELGVLLSGVDGTEREWARELGETLGTAFQIIDDTLDYNGNAELMGKSTLMDVMAGNNTLPLIHSLRDMSPEEQSKVLADNGKSIEKISELVDERGGVEYSIKRAQDFSSRAREIVARFDNEKVLASFDSFIDLVLNRHS